jgi:hypothetical protein
MDLLSISLLQIEFSLNCFIIDIAQFYESNQSNAFGFAFPYNTIHIFICALIRHGKSAVVASSGGISSSWQGVQKPQTSL